MNGFSTTQTGRLDDSGAEQVTLGCRRGAYVKRFIGRKGVLSRGICVTVHRYGGHAELTTGPYDPHRYFAAIGDKNFPEHGAKVAG
jgi:hypothetical protein